MIIPISIFLSLLVGAFFLRQYVQNDAFRNKYFKFILLLIIVAFFGYCLVSRFLIYDTPESFDKGVELLRNKKEVNLTIGGYESFSYYEKDLPQKNDNPANFKVSINGTKAILYISCTVKKDNQGVWHIIQLTKDSVKNK